MCIRDRDQAADDVIEQELNEYVITRELKKHFITFFNYYGDAFDQPTADMGVWISGFFGSGKSHFLKMLSYLLENKEVKGIHSVERFRKKFEDDPATFMPVSYTHLDVYKRQGSSSVYVSDWKKIQL